MKRLYLSRRARERLEMILAAASAQAEEWRRDRDPAEADEGEVLAEDDVLEAVAWFRDRLGLGLK